MEMRSFVHLTLVMVTLLLFTTGCQRSLFQQGQVQQLQQQQQTLAQENQQLRVRSDSLDKNNQEMQTLYAEEKRANELLKEQLAVVRDELNTTVEKLAGVENKRDELNRLVSDRRARAGATIKANSSLDDQLALVDIQGVEVRRDGDVIRIELPADQIFVPRSEQLTSAAAKTIARVAGEIVRSYPQHTVGIEGHTDNQPLPPGRFGSTHQLSVAQSLAMYNYIVASTEMRGSQLFVTGHAGNHPVVSNATDAGRARNRRIELVIYPHLAGGR
jgi:flagellar motor protein MotB